MSCRGNNLSTKITVSSTNANPEIRFLTPKESLPERKPFCKPKYVLKDPALYNPSVQCVQLFSFSDEQAVSKIFLKLD